MPEANSKSVRIGGREIGQGRPVFVIAEAGVNHNGDPEMARRLVDAAVAAGADAVKFQTFKTERLVSRAAPKAEYQMKTTERSESQFAMLKKLELSEAQHRELRDYCAQKGILFLSTPFNEEDADFLGELGVAAFKMSSGDLTNWPFIEHLARTGRPVILSTGMSYLSEVDEAVRVFREAGGRDLLVLQCVSDYPTTPAEANLRAMDVMEQAFGVPVGFSDHTLGMDVTLAAAALGACIIEKHLTLDKTLPGPDHKASLEPDEFIRLVAGIRSVESALGDGLKRPMPGEVANIPIGRKSLHWRESLPPGVVVSADHFVALRPGDGISPTRLRSLIGRKTAIAVNGGDVARDADFAG